MKKIAFSLALIVTLVVMAHLRRPDLAAHQEQILARAALLGGRQTAATLPKPPLDFIDLFVVTLTRDPETHALVSFGFGRYIKVLDDAWGARALALPPATAPR